MRKLLLGAAMLLMVQMSFGQMVSDNATIPVSVTLNAILRLNVVSGGNIQFVFNTMDQYTGGIENTLGTTTTFTVASSRAFTVSIQAEDDALYGVDDVLNDIPLGSLIYTMGASGVGEVDNAPHALTDAQFDIVTAGVAGSVDLDRTFEVLWEAGTGAPLTGNPPDVYVTNVFLNLQPI